jgi:hypothetical protein
VRDWVEPPPVELAMLAANGIFAGAAVAATAAAYRHADAARLGPWGFAALPVSFLLDFAIWAHRPDPAMLAGAAVVVLACVMSERAARPPRARMARQRRPSGYPGREEVDAPRAERQRRGRAHRRERQDAVEVREQAGTLPPAAGSHRRAGPSAAGVRLHQDEVRLPRPVLGGAGAELRGGGEVQEPVPPVVGAAAVLAERLRLAPVGGADHGVDQRLHRAADTAVPPSAEARLAPARAPPLLFS